MNYNKLRFLTTYLVEGQSWGEIQIQVYHWLANHSSLILSYQVYNTEITSEWLWRSNKIMYVNHQAQMVIFNKYYFLLF